MNNMAAFKSINNEIFQNYYEKYYIVALDQLHIITVPSEDRLHIDAFSINVHTIFYDPLLIDKFKLSEMECLSCIAHEIGHYITPPEIKNQCELELYADRNVIDLGLSEYMMSALNKMCPEEEITKLRIEQLKKSIS